MNLIKKWLGIYHIEHQIQDLQIEINELKRASDVDRDHIAKLCTIALVKSNAGKPKAKPGRKPKKKVEQKDGQ